MAATAGPVPAHRKTIRERLCPPMPAGGWIGWIGPVLVTLLAAALRLPSLGTPRAVVFDETYYMKDGLSLLLFGYERGAVDGADKLILDSNGDPSGLASVFKDDASFVVHPPVGKWVIATGEQLFGVTPFGWRIGVCVLGILAVLIAARIGRRLMRSNLLGTLVGFLIAIDGLSIVMSRTALLDTSLMFFVLCAFGFLLLDRDRTRRKLADLAEKRENALYASTQANAVLGIGTSEVRDSGLDSIMNAPGYRWSSFGPGLGLRPWRIAAGVSLGLACGVKWSGLYYVIGFGLLAVLWDFGARKAAGVDKPFLGMLLRDALGAFVSLVVLAGAVYLATWTGWFLSTNGWDRQWAATNANLTWIPAALRPFPEALLSLLHYHQEAYNFHRGLSTPHAYQANAWVWPIQGRPTSFFYESPATGCGEGKSCAQEVLALGNPVIWWSACVAMIYQVWRWFAHRDWRSGAILCAFIAGWVPWLFFQERTVFEFYSIVFEPFMIMALVLTMGVMLGKADAPGNRRVYGAMAVGGLLLAAVVACWFFYPIWTGEIIPYDDWHLRMWFPTWI